MMTAFQINVTKTITINRIKCSSIEVLIKRGSEKDNKTIRIFFKIISSTNRFIGNSNNFHTRYNRKDKAIIDMTIFT